MEVLTYNTMVFYQSGTGLYENRSQSTATVGATAHNRFRMVQLRLRESV